MPRGTSFIPAQNCVSQGRTKAGDTWETGAVASHLQVNHLVPGDKWRCPLSLSTSPLLCEGLTNNANEGYTEVIKTSPCKSRVTMLGLSRPHFSDSIMTPITALTFPECFMLFTYRHYLLTCLPPSFDNTWVYLLRLLLNNRIVPMDW